MATERDEHGNRIKYNHRPRGPRKHKHPADVSGVDGCTWCTSTRASELFHIRKNGFASGTHCGLMAGANSVPHGVLTRASFPHAKACMVCVSRVLVKKHAAAFPETVRNIRQVAQSMEHEPGKAPEDLARRIKRIQDALKPYQNDDPEMDLVDMLADAQHFAAQHGLNFAECLRVATGHYEDERPAPN